MSTVLGKRQRCSESQGNNTRSKRISVAHPIAIHNDENKDPLEETLVSMSKTPRKSAVVVITPRKASTASQPAKQGTPKSRVKATPNTDISSHFAVAKASPSLLVQKLDPLDTENAILLKTPRHRDTPTKVLISPNTRVSTPRALRTPRTPRTPRQVDRSPEEVENVYTRARQAFHSRSDMATLVGRGEEKARLSTFVSERLESCKGGCLYVSGPPGTGKSAFVGLVLDELRSTSTFTSTSINCMSVKTLRDFTERLYDGLGLDIQRGAAFEDLKTHLSSNDSGMPFVLVLDEIDRILELDLKALYALFDWSMQPDSNIILIGIANALDLTDRLLPRLKSRDIKPDLLPFMPYDATQIEHILTAKLKSLVSDDATSDYIPIIHPAAIVLCSKKIAAHTGDLRKAFDVCSRAVDLIEQETKAQQARVTLAAQSPTKPGPLTENINLSSPGKKATTNTITTATNGTPRQLRLSANLSHLTCQTAPRATIAHMARITSSIFSNGTTQRLATLNMQQKAALYSLAGLEERNRALAEATRLSTPSKRFGNSAATAAAAAAGMNSNTATNATNSIAPTIRQLYGIYSSLCKRDNSPLHPLTSGEFRDVLGGLETLSLVSVVGDRGGFSAFAVPVTPSRTPSRRGRAAFFAGGGGGGGASGRSAGVTGGTGLAGIGSVADEKRMVCCVGRRELMNSLQGPGSDLLRDMLEGADLSCLT